MKFDAISIIDRARAVTIEIPIWRKTNCVCLDWLRLFEKLLVQFDQNVAYKSENHRILDRTYLIRIDNCFSFR